MTVAYTNITTLITAHTKNVRMQALAPGSIFNAAEAKLTTAILVPKDAPVRSGPRSRRENAPDVVARSTRFIDAEYLDPALIAPVIGVLVKYGIIDRAFPASELISPYALSRPG